MFCAMSVRVPMPRSRYKPGQDTREAPHMRWLEWTDLVRDTHPFPRASWSVVGCTHRHI
jgi:hypothetical protein